MKYTENGLEITLLELRELLEEAENNAKYHNMSPLLCVKNGANNRPKIFQSSSYAECNPKDLTYGV